MIERADYAVTVRNTGPKEGVAESDESALPLLPVGTPPEFGGRPGLWSPEHLFVASVASCFMSTFLAIAELSRLEVDALAVPALGTIERGEDRRYRFTRVVLRPRIVLVDAGDSERAERIVTKAEQACLVTRSISTEVVIEPALEVVGVPQTVGG
jgi:organic hydroperoxide reductase OsmC/OhrA